MPTAFLPPSDLISTSACRMTVPNAFRDLRPPNPVGLGPTEGRPFDGNP